jgi:multiple sugar transport system permease protein
MAKWQPSFIPEIWNSTVHNGKFYGPSPYVDMGTFLAYNKQMFQEAGIAKVPETWDELRDAAKKLTKSDRAGIALLLGLGVGYFLSFDLLINRILRASILIPWILPAVVSVASWRWIYSAEEGILNDVLKRIGLIQRGIPWLGDPSLVMYALVVVAVWRHLPFASLVVSAAVQGIPSSFLEAATIDGANG